LADSASRLGRVRAGGMRILRTLAGSLRRGMDVGVTAALCATIWIATPMPAAAAGADDAGRDGDVIGTRGLHTVAEGETLLDLARRYDVGFIELRAANPGLDAWIPPVGTPVVLPTLHILPDAPRQGIVINLAELRLYYFASSGAFSASYPIGIGREGWETPEGRTRIVRKRRDPSWTPPASIRADQPGLPAVIPPGPANPLGRFALDLAWESYLLHGTNKPNGVGRRVSHGCIRLYPEDIERLFEAVAVGTPVTVVNQEIKLGWSGGALYMEMHPNLAQALEVEARGTFSPAPPPDIQAAIERALGEASVELDRQAVDRVVRERSGVPVRITR